MLLVALLWLAVARASSPPRLLSPLPPEQGHVSPERLAAALAWAELRVARQDRSSPPQSNSTTPAHYHGRRHASDAETQQRGRQALLLAEAERAPLVLRLSTHLKLHLTNATGCQTPPPPQPACNFTAARYRSIDGSCNHPSQPLWGATHQPFTRLGHNTFDDGVLAPRASSVTGEPLASARRISQTVIGNRSEAHTGLTLSVMQWGQFLDHDLTLTPTFLTSSGQLILCCGADGRPLPDPHPQCLPIEIPSDDPFYSQHGQRCMEFVRSLPAPPRDCRPAPAAHMNVLTSYLDASQVYGSQQARSTLLRELRGGLLRTSGANMPPTEPASAHAVELPCLSAAPHEPCFLSGDIRINDQVSLTVVHTVWMREHNRIARQLATLNPHWDDETLFQEARRVVAAQIQHITYQEWLPIILGSKTVQDNLIANEEGDNYSERYIETLNPTMSTEFSTAAYRFGHSLVQSMIELHDKVSSEAPAFTHKVPLRDVFLRPRPIHRGKVDQLAMGLVMQPPQVCDANVVRDLTNHLFRPVGAGFGMDLVALNIQRGRDHGIASYNSMRQRCGLRRAVTFTDLLDEIPAEAVNNMASVYAHVEDIDLFIGAIAERPVTGAVVGPTMNCIIADQFTRLRWGDNFFYDLGGSQRPWRFSRQQLRQLKHTSWARVLCNNIEGIRSLQTLAFKTPDDGNNNPTPCRNLPSIDLRYWKTRS